jgi:orotate phosphoribosyltransferase-like protein
MGPAKRVVEVASPDLVSEDEVATRLSLSMNRVRWLIINGHLQRGVTADGSSGGLTRQSVETEAVWRRDATVTQRARRALGDVFFWMP